MLVPPDGDDVVRRYQRAFPVPDSAAAVGGVMMERLLPLELLAAAGRLDSSSDKMRFINFYGGVGGEHRKKLSATQVLDELKTYNVLRKMNDSDAPQVLRDKLVLVGVTYRGLDEHNTPLGWMNGVQLLAQIAETDATNIRPRHRDALTAVIVVAAFVVAVSFSAMRTLRAVGLSVATLLAAALWLWWSSRSYRDPLLLAAVCVAVLGQQLYLALSDKLQKQKVVDAYREVERAAAQEARQI